LGSPWITNADDLNILNLKIPDFALHDTLTDMIQLLKSKDLLMEDIQSLVNHLKDQEKTLLGSEQKLKVTNTRLSALIQNLNSAILVENENRQIALTNQLFCTLFKISAPPEDLIGVDCSNAAEQSKLFFKEPDIFVLRINEILYKKEIVLNEEVYMLDGKVLERDFIPITFQNEYQGHLWQYRDITSRKLNEKELIEAKENAIQSESRNTNTYKYYKRLDCFVIRK
jgi:PAS domain-containing protein